MKIAIFFDGQNFYRSLLRYDESLRVDYDRLAAWITQQVGVATWSAEDLSKDLRVRCFGHIHLSDGVSAFRVERRPHERAPGRAAASRLAPPAAGLAASSQLERGLEELQRAEARLPHVSRGYFVMRWKSHALPPVGSEREALVQQLG